MRRLGERIEYSPTAIYAHFADKDALLTGLSVCDFRAFTDRFGFVPRDLPPLDRLRGLGRAYVKFAMEHPAQYRHLFMTKRVVSEAAMAAKPEEDAYALLIATVEACVQSGDLHASWAARKDEAAQILWAALHGMVTLHMTNAKQGDVPLVPVEALAEVAMSVLVAGMQAG